MNLTLTLQDMKIGTSPITDEDVVISDNCGRCIIVNENDLLELQYLISAYASAVPADLSPDTGHTVLSSDMKRKIEDRIDAMREKMSYEEGGFDD